MGDGPADGSPAGLVPLHRADHEPGERAIFATVSLLHAVIGPLTHRDWHDLDKLPRTGGVIVVANHISNVDPLALGQYVAFAGRWPRFLAKSSLFGIPVVGAVIAACGQIPVQRNSATAKDALDAAVLAVDAGRALVVYPEGTISRDPELWPMRGRTGAARVALRTGAPVVPVGQWGAQDILYGNRLGLPRLFPRKTFRLRTGDPVVLDDLRGRPLTAAVLEEATARIMAAITALVADLRSETPPAEPFDPRRSRVGDVR